jgi:hypothetical protein
MNNQAAQTMPELPEPAMPASSGGVEGNWEGDTYPDLYDAAQMHQYARDYAAALSQTAGVVEPARYFASGPQGHFFADDLQLARDLVNLYDKDDDWTITDLRNPTGAAPAASGGEYPECSGNPASCPENEGYGCCKPNPPRHIAIVCDWKDADPFPRFIEAEVGGQSVSLEWRDRTDGLKELIVPVTAAPQPPSAASVSERAREILSQAYRDAGFDKAAEWVLQVDLDNELYVLDRAVIRALEQALTQQRAPSSPRQEGEAVEMSPEFTDSARAAIAWVLYHHQGGSSPVGQALRFALGMGAHEPLPDWRIAEAKRWAERMGATTADFHRHHQQPAAPSGEAVAWLRMKPDGTPDWAEDCIGSDDRFLDHELASDGYYLQPLYAAPKQPAGVDGAMPALVELVATLAATGTVTGGRIYFPERQTRELLKKACAALATQQQVGAE